jgi:2-iminobutanoate/2-iminopropanoate deaminase
MPRKAITSDKAPAPGGAYSHAIRAGDFVYVSGTVGKNPNTGEMGATITEQTAQTLDNIKAILAAGGASLNDVVKSTVHLSDLSLFAAFNDVYAGYFGDPRPVRTTVGSQLAPGILVEIDVVAYTGA